MFADDCSSAIAVLMYNKSYMHQWLQIEECTYPLGNLYRLEKYFVCIEHKKLMFMKVMKPTKELGGIQPSANNALEPVASKSSAGMPLGMREC